MSEARIALSDFDLIARLTMTEDQFVERKPKNQPGDWLQATIAFANSTPIGYPAVLFIGVNDAGEIAENLKTGDLMKSYSDFIAERAWPPIANFPKTLAHAGRECVVVIIPGSPERPHFAGKSYIRQGTQTKEASINQFERLIAERNSKVREILKWRETEVNFEETVYDGRKTWRDGKLFDCNQFIVTIDFGDQRISYPLGKIEISIGHKADHSQHLILINDTR